MKYFFSFIFCSLFSIFYFQPADALTMSNDNYILQSPVISSDSKSDNTQEFNSADQPKNPNPEPNYTIEFDNKTKPFLSPLILSLSQSLIDFGPIAPTDPVLRNHTINITNKDMTDFTLQAFENGPLTDSSIKRAVPDTTCDDGLCSEKRASAWSNTLTYGFGYRCNNLFLYSCSTDFQNPYFYKQFSNLSNKPTPEIVLSDSGKTEIKAEITYKLNLSGTQPRGAYKNTVTYILVSNY